jgi:hypothetical protein
MRTEAKAAGRDPDAIVFSSTIFMPMLADTEAAAHDFASGMGGVFGLDAAAVMRMPMALIGTPEQCVAELRRRERAWGTLHYIMSGFGGPALAERFVREVAPKAVVTEPLDASPITIRADALPSPTPDASVTGFLRDPNRPTNVGTSRGRARAAGRKSRLHRGDERPDLPGRLRPVTRARARRRRSSSASARA